MSPQHRWQDIRKSSHDPGRDASVRARVGSELARLPRFHHCDQCDSDHDVTLVDYDPMTDGPGDIASEWLCRECRDAQPR